MSLRSPFHSGSLPRLSALALGLALLGVLFSLSLISLPGIGQAATAEKNLRKLKITVTGPGRVSGPGIKCPGDCWRLAHRGKVLRIRPVAGAGARFLGWRGACADSNTCRVSLNKARTLQARFKASSKRSTLSVSVTGSGRISGPGIDCPGDCFEKYVGGSSVNLAAAPLAGASFSGWGGACSGTASTCSLSMSSNRSASANFSPTQPPPPPPPPDTSGAFPPIPAGFSLLREDPATDPSPYALWGDIDAVSPSRHQLISSGGPGGGPFRRMTALDGDLYHGDSERAELGNSSYELDSNGQMKTFYLYREGQRRITNFWMRLPTDFPIDSEEWQVVMQMKQSEPASNADGTPIIALQAIEGDWILKQSLSSGLSEDTRYLWQTPATVGPWTPISVDATYSTDPTKGKIQITIAGVQSPVFNTYTLKREIRPAGPGLAVGDSIPSHLRMGIYHDPIMPGTHVDFSQVQVWG